MRGATGSVIEQLRSIVPTFQPQRTVAGSEGPEAAGAREAARVRDGLAPVVPGPDDAGLSDLEPVAV